MTKLLITGGSGFVGYNLARFFVPQKNVTVTHLNSPIPADILDRVQGIQLDIRDADAVLGIMEQFLPDVVIHSAGCKNVNYCETHPEEAYQINAIGTQNIARACHNIGARLIYISTDLVFDCTQGGYRETDLPQPNLVYGKTKLQGEKLAAQELDDLVICRSGGIYGKKSPLLSWLNTLLNSDNVVECFTDVFNTPTYVDNLAEMIDIIIEKRFSGIFHTVGRERVNRFQFFKAYASIFGYDINLLLPVAAGASKAKMLLQADASLSIEQTYSKLDVNFNSVAEGLTRLKITGGI